MSDGKDYMELFSESADLAGRLESTVRDHLMHLELELAAERKRLVESQLELAAERKRRSATPPAPSFSVSSALERERAELLHVSAQLLARSGAAFVSTRDDGVGLKIIVERDANRDAVAVVRSVDLAAELIAAVDRKLVRNEPGRCPEDIVSSFGSKVRRQCALAVGHAGDCAPSDEPLGSAS